MKDSREEQKSQEPVLPSTITPSIVDKSKDLPETEEHQTMESPPLSRGRAAPQRAEITHQVSTCSQTDELYSRTSPQPALTATHQSTVKRMVPKLQGYTTTTGSGSSPGYTAPLSPRHIAMMVIQASPPHANQNVTVFPPPAARKAVPKLSMNDIHEQAAA